MPSYALTVDVPESEADDLAALLLEEGAAGAEVRDGSVLPMPDAPRPAPGRALVVAFFAARDQADAAAAAVGVQGAIAELADQDWGERWKEGLVPFSVGRVFIRFSWAAAALPPGAVEVVLDPGMAFGTGTHPTTALCLAGLDALLASAPAADVLDVGTGSGLLAIAARKLGAGRVAATENDPDALRVAEENAQRNGVAIELHLAPPSAVPGSFPVVVANILANTLVDLAPQIAARLAPGGTAPPLRHPGRAGVGGAQRVPRAGPRARSRQRAQRGRVAPPGAREAGVRRLFVPRPRLSGDRAALEANEVHYLRDVLRLAPGALIEVFDGEGGTREGRLAAADDGRLLLELGTRRDAPAPAARVHLAFALARGDRPDLVVQKATEVGAARLLPFEAERSVVHLDRERGAERARRWQRIAAEAARQCGRADVPEVASPAPLAQVLAEAPPGLPDAAPLRGRRRAAGAGGGRSAAGHLSSSGRRAGSRRARSRRRWPQAPTSPPSALASCASRRPPSWRRRSCSTSPATWDDGRRRRSPADTSIL